MYNQKKLDEGLQAHDLKNFVYDIFTIDQYKSKMGEDRDIVVLGFRVKEKYPAIDLMEFIERGYDFILDADMSSGEERDGYYKVFVELERTGNLPSQLLEMLGGVGQLCGIDNWKFRYQKSKSIVEFNKQSIVEQVPMTANDYDIKILKYKNTDIKEFFDQGAVEVSVSEDNIINFSKPFSTDINAKFISIGDYDTVKDTVPGKLNLDESGQSQVLFLTKYLGNYDIEKIDTKFLIRNGTRAVVIEKDTW